MRCEAAGPGFFYVHEVVGDLVILSRSEFIEALDINDCSVTWSWKRNSVTGVLPALFEDTLYVVDEAYPDSWQFELVAIDVMTGAEKWRSSVDARNGVNLQSGVLLVQGVSEIFGVDPESGTIQWRMRPTTYEFFTPYPSQGGRLFISEVETSPAGFATNVSALDVSTGEVAWSLKFNDTFGPLITTGPERVAIFTLIPLGGEDSADISQTQVGVDVLTGQQLWERNIDLDLDIHFLEHLAYATHRKAPDTGMSIVALDVGSGQTVWSTEIPDGWFRFTTRFDELLLVGIQDTTQKSAPLPPWRLLAYDIASGSLVWSRVLQYNFNPELEWEIVDGAVVFAEGYTLNAVDIETGELAWTFSAPTTHAAAQIAAGNGVVVVTSFDDPALFLEPPKFNP